MKKLNSNLPLKLSGILTLAAVCFAVLLVIQSCKKTREPNKSALKYLDLNIGETKVLNPVQGLVLREAQKRLEKFVVVENGLYILKLTNPDEVNLSQNLFNYLKGSLASTNDFIRAKKLVLYENKLFVPGQLGDKRIKTFDINSDTWEDGQGNSVDLGVWGVTIRLNNESTTALFVTDGIAASITYAIPGYGVYVGTVLCGAVAGAYGYYSNYGNSQGITIFIPYVDLIPGVPPTGVYYNLNQSGNRP